MSFFLQNYVISVTFYKFALTLSFLLAIYIISSYLKKLDINKYILITKIIIEMK